MSSRAKSIARMPKPSCLACTNWKTMDVIERLERELGKPVLSTTQVTIWTALRAIGRIEGVPGYGRLLRDLLAPSKRRSSR